MEPSLMDASYDEVDTHSVKIKKEISRGGGEGKRRVQGGQQIQSRPAKSRVLGRVVLPLLAAA